MTDPIRLSTLGVRYGDRDVLGRISLTVPKGSVYALLGRNGAGKSSLIRCLLGLQKPTEGEALLFGESAWEKRAALMQRVGVVPEEPDAPADITLARLEAYCRELYPTWDGGRAAGRALAGKVPRDVPFGRLSKGEKGLALLTLALAHGPELLVLDDPTLGLDPVARHFLFDELIGELAERGTTIFLTTHDLSGVEKIADRVGILKDGALVVDEELDVLKQRFRRIHYANEPVDDQVLGAELDRFDAVRVKVRGWGVDAVVSNYDEAAFAGFQEQAGVVDAESAAMSLEEIFLAAVGEERGARK